MAEAEERPSLQEAQQEAMSGRPSGAPSGSGAPMSGLPSGVTVPVSRPSGVPSRSSAATSGRGMGRDRTDRSLLLPTFRFDRMSVFTTITVQTTFTEAMEQFGLGLEELKSTMATPAVSNGTQYTVLALLCLNPVARGYRAVGFGAARQSSEGFSVVMPGLVSSASMLLITSALLVLWDGWQEARRLFDKKYLVMIVPGGAAGLMILLGNMAYARLAPSLVTLVLQTSSIFAVILQCIVFRRVPSHTQILTLVATSLLLPVYFMSTQEDDDSSDDEKTSGLEAALGVGFALAGACSTALYNILFEWANRKCKGAGDKFGASLKRAMVSCEIGRLMMCIILLFAMDHEFVFEKGLFYAWDVAVLGGAVGGLIIQGFFASLCLAFVGAVMTRLSSSLEIIVVYAADLLLLKTADFDLRNALLLAAIFTVVILYHISAVDQQKAARIATVKAISSVQQLANEKLGDKTPKGHKSRGETDIPAFRNSTVSFLSHPESASDGGGSSARGSLQQDGFPSSARGSLQQVQELQGETGENNMRSSLSSMPEEEEDRSRQQPQQEKAVSRSSEACLEVGRESIGTGCTTAPSRPLVVQSGEKEPMEEPHEERIAGPDTAMDEPLPALLGNTQACWSASDKPPVDAVERGLGQTAKPVMCSITCNM